jgi:hypothetical protein
MNSNVLLYDVLAHELGYKVLSREQEIALRGAELARPLRDGESLSPRRRRVSRRVALALVHRALGLPSPPTPQGC